MGEIERWPSRSISNTIQQLGGAKEDACVVQNLNDAIERRKKRITTVGNQDEDAARLSGDFADERDHGPNQAKRFDFCKTDRAGIHNYMNEQIQHIGSKVSQEILAMLKSSCEQFRNEARGATGFFKGFPWRNFWRGGSLGPNR